MVGVLEAKLRRTQQFWSHVMDGSRLGYCRAVSLHDRGVGDDCCDSKVSKTRVSLLGD